MKTSLIRLTAFGETTTESRDQAATYCRILRKAGFRLVRDRVRSCVGITAWHGDSGFVAVSYRITPAALIVESDIFRRNGHAAPPFPITLTGDSGHAEAQAATLARLTTRPAWSLNP